MVANSTTATSRSLEININSVNGTLASSDDKNSTMTRSTHDTKSQSTTTAAVHDEETDEAIIIDAENSILSPHHKSLESQSTPGGRTSNTHKSDIVICIPDEESVEPKSTDAPEETDTIEELSTLSVDCDKKNGDVVFNKNDNNIIEELSSTCDVTITEDSNIKKGRAPEDGSLPPPPAGCPDYKKKSCNCEKMSLKVRLVVERSSYNLYHEALEIQARGEELNDAWFRTRIYDGVNVSSPLKALHDHYAGMGGRSHMGAEVGGFAVGAATPSGGLCTVPAVTYDLPWFASLLNWHLKIVMERDKPEEVEHVKAKVPDVWTCWQLNFGKNEREVLSDTCFYNPHVDKNNAKVVSIGTSFGDYDGGGVWISDVKGDVIVKFEEESHGINSGFVPGFVKKQKTKWLTFWAATRCHAIPPFRKNRIGIVAFSSISALRTTETERVFLKAIGFVIPELDDDRFLPPLPDNYSVHKVDLPFLSKERALQRRADFRQYTKKSSNHIVQDDKIKIAVNRETYLINQMQLLGKETKNDEGKHFLIVDSFVPEENDGRDDREIQRCVDCVEANAKEIQIELKKLVIESLRMLEGGSYKECLSLKEIWETLEYESLEKLTNSGGTKEDDLELFEDVETDEKDRLLKKLKMEPVQFYPSLSRKLNLSVKDRKMMERKRWKHKIKYGTLKNLPKYQPKFENQFRTGVPIATSSASSVVDASLTQAAQSSTAVPKIINESVSSGEVIEIASDDSDSDVKEISVSNGPASGSTQPIIRVAGLKRQDPGDLSHRLEEYESKRIKSLFGGFMGASFFPGETMSIDIKPLADITNAAFMSTNPDPLGFHISGLNQLAMLQAAQQAHRLKELNSVPDGVICLSDSDADDEVEVVKEENQEQKNSAINNIITNNDDDSDSDVMVVG